MIVPSSSRYSSNDMVYNHYLEEAKKKTQESGRNSRPNVMPSATSESTANDCKPKPKINNQNSRNWPASKSSCVMTKIVSIAEHSRNSRNFFDSNILFARHVRNVWKPTGKIFKYVGLRWVPTGKIFTSNTTNVDSEPTNGSNDDITNQYVCEQTLDVSACTLKLSACTSFNHKKKGLKVWLLKILISQKPGLQGIPTDEQAMTFGHNSSELRIQDHSNEPSSSKLVPKVVPSADTTAPLKQELDLLRFFVR
nr:hypothetical protein [Tanacetum cinerariifolium]